MNSGTLTQLKLSAMRTANLVENLPTEEWFVQPTGFANNIAWNVGHIMQVQQSILYRLAGLETYIPDEFAGLYGAGTSPADWETEPDVVALVELLKELPAKIEADVASGRFEGIQYEGLKIANGMFPFLTLDDAAVFNTWHEGIHIGVIMSIIDTRNA